MARVILRTPSGVVISDLEITEKQQRFLESDKRYVGYSGGFACGKSLALVIKIYQLLTQFPKNYGLLGRYNFTDLRDSTLKDFLDYCPSDLIKSHNKQERKITLINGSELAFRGLKDVKKTEVRSLNLGFFALEQAEEIEEPLFDELSGRLRRRLIDINGNEGKCQGFIICNPGRNWVFKKFVQEKHPDMEMIDRGSTFENAHNLSQSFLDDLLSKPESWKRQFVYGEWEEGTDRDVFPFEYIKAQEDNIKTHIDRLDDIFIWKQPIPGHEYQMGIDPSEGAEDSSVIKVIDKNTGEEVASYSSRIQPDLLAFKVAKVGRHYYNAKAVLEINGIGMSTKTKLQDLNYENMYLREEHDRIAKTIIKVLKPGWRTTHSSKPLLVGHFQELLGKGFVKLRDEQTLDEMKTYVYSPEASKRGMGAEKGYHDDRITAVMLAYWDVKAIYNEDDTDLIIDTEEKKKPQDGTFDDLKFDNALNEQSNNWLQN